MRTIIVCGMGAGSPEYLTKQAISGLSSAAAVFALDKGDVKADLLQLRQQIVDTHAPGTPIITVTDPKRDRHPVDYDAEVRRWHAERARLLATSIKEHSPEDSTIAFLVWGDPSLYDSTLRIIDSMVAHEDLEVAVRVIPGITAVQVLCAEHAIVLNRIGEAIHITTGRKLPDTPASLRRNVVVMLDGGAAWLDGYTDNTYMWWGAFLGTEHQVLREGYVATIGQEVAALKKSLRADHGWIMDTYLLREITPGAPVRP